MPIDLVPEFWMISMEVDPEVINDMQSEMFRPIFSVCFCTVGFHLAFWIFHRFTKLSLSSQLSENECKWNMVIRVHCMEESGESNFLDK